MTTSDNAIDKKLAFYRKILWFCFCVVSLVGLGMCVTSYAATIKSPFVTELIFPTIILVASIGILGTICLGIYRLIKNHLEKDESLFL